MTVEFFKISSDPSAVLLKDRRYATNERKMKSVGLKVVGEGTG